MYLCDGMSNELKNQFSSKGVVVVIVTKKILIEK